MIKKVTTTKTGRRRISKPQYLLGVNFNLNLPWYAAHSPGGKRRDLGRVEGLLEFVCDVLDAQRQSVTTPEMQRWIDEMARLMQAAAEGRLDSPSDQFVQEIGARFESGVRSKLEKAADGSAVFRYTITGSDGFYALLAVLLMHPMHRSLVMCCPECSNFFVRRGKRRFCSNSSRNCAQAANDAGQAQRQRHRRLRRAAEDLLPHVASGAKRVAAVRQALKDHPELSTGGPEDFRRQAEELAKHARALLVQLPRKSR